jgi:hypothetical protein
MATYTHPIDFYAPVGGDRPNYHRPLAATDFNRFDVMVCAKSPAQIKIELEQSAAGKGNDIEKALSENIDKIQAEVFQKEDRIVGGAQILLVVADEFNLVSKEKEVTTFRYGQVAWLLGYVKARSGHLKE